MHNLEHLVRMSNSERLQNRPLCSPLNFADLTYILTNHQIYVSYELFYFSLGVKLSDANFSFYF